jgi:lipoprotein-anchoring transpeptidase ErfK/SrfK
VALAPINTFLVADRDRFTLHLHTRPLLSSEFHVTDRYPISVGRAGYETPRGLYLIRQRSACPEWTMPDSDWVQPPELRGVTVPCGDPRNPIRARWLGIHDGVGIHGTLDRPSIGTAASHGCLRMLVEDVVELYPRVHVNTPIYIV